MIFAKWIRDFVQFVPFLMLCGTLCAAPAFQVTETALSFGDLTFGQSRTLSFKVINLQATQLTVTMRQVTALFSISFGSGSQLCQPCQLTLGPNEIKVVDVTFPGTPRCVQVKYAVDGYRRIGSGICLLECEASMSGTSIRWYRPQPFGARK